MLNWRIPYRNFLLIKLDNHALGQTLSDFNSLLYFDWNAHTAAITRLNEFKLRAARKFFFLNEVIFSEGFISLPMQKCACIYTFVHAHICPFLLNPFNSTFSTIGRYANMMS